MHDTSRFSTPGDPWTSEKCIQKKLCSVCTHFSGEGPMTSIRFSRGPNSTQKNSNLLHISSNRSWGLQKVRLRTSHSPFSQQEGGKENKWKQLARTRQGTTPECYLLYKFSNMFWVREGKWGCKCWWKLEERRLLRALSSPHKHHTWVWIEQQQEFKMQRNASPIFQFQHIDNLFLFLSYHKLQSGYFKKYYSACV